MPPNPQAHRLLHQTHKIYILVRRLIGGGDGARAGRYIFGNPRAIVGEALLFLGGRRRRRRRRRRRDGPDIDPRATLSCVSDAAQTLLMRDAYIALYSCMSAARGRHPAAAGIINGTRARFDLPGI